MTQVEAREAYRIVAPFYDAAPNPLIALEERILRVRLPELHGQMIVDVASGTGRWAVFAAKRGARVIAVDLCREMLARCGVRDRVEADMLRLPFADGFADLAICSLAMGYVASPGTALREMARVARRVIVSDLHPDAVRRGWVRSFRTADGPVEIRHYEHALTAFGTPEWIVEARFGAEERDVFAAAGRQDLYFKTRGLNAIFAASWVSS